MNQRATPVILTIAGSDSGGGAGIQADVRTITMLGAHPATAITAITAQNTMGVHAIHPVPAETVLDQIDAVLADFPVSAIKVGMTGSAFTTRAIAQRLRELDGKIPIIVDPVIVATAGDRLADEATVEALGELFEIATLSTPNMPEVVTLTGEEDPIAGALQLVGRHGSPVLLTGGHEEGEALADALIEDDNITSWQGTRIETRHDHGTGCTLSAAIAAFVGGGVGLNEAIDRARMFVRMGLHEAPGLGEGHGPLGISRIRMDVGATGRDVAPRLNQLTVTGTDYDKMVDFYRRIGLRQIVDSPDNQYARFETGGGATFSVQCDPDAPVAENFAVYFECDDLDTRVERLAREGLPFEHGPRAQPWMWREARLRDPAGNTVFLYKAGENRRYPPWRMGEDQEEMPS
ncbi:bifunctional hydroxymethylpyrimidine kinase/phosphomethylpyrimidine kinase [Sphingomicrobium aestuariivivum]|uniref:bifunctional hydroxymethylpyrimidine kinase/phosphomethylpyrimidine kinase n=1 Tax=Sphingomicrobium aestuariivivum TaxID=1582356 RepID=UPI001FD65637|nr:bifunctional hydroxymethylpyrimidine kinase/phosphomethylpyrimidine kinase [Sphingomicrobium aestuariivivum]MCJ8191999.1 bifunctional hydroxymethylpyrimidine kinase/phosphomethylpyrimidine kinase [Sphingomicrobium aestuariivivum]